MSASSITNKNSLMLDFSLIVRTFGRDAVALRIAEAEDWDDPALGVLRNIGAPQRAEAIRAWLKHYGVLQGFTTSQGLALATAFVDWSDSRNKDAELDGTKSIIQAHTDLETLCSRVDGRGRNFTSFASKALWLRYPNAVPMFDKFAQQALYTLHKLDRHGITIDEEGYGQFVRVWHFFYELHQDELRKLNTQGYPYRVRIFDTLLWMLGNPSYHFTK